MCGACIIQKETIIQLTIIMIDFCTAIEHESKKLYGVQFHPEVDLTTNGAAMFKNFLYGVSRQFMYMIENLKI